MIEAPQNAEIINFKKHLFWFDENGIVCGKSKKGELTEMEDMMELRDYFINRLQGSKACILIDFSNVTQANKPTRDFVNNEFPKITKALAMIAKNPLGRMMANLFFNLKKPSYPTKMFDAEEDAKEWLKHYL